MEILYGLHPVEEALRSGSRRFDHVVVARERQDQRLKKILEACRERGVRVRSESREQLTLLARNPGHQGVVAFVRERTMLEMEDLLRRPVLRRCCWPWTAWKIRKIWERCCALRMARA